MLDNSSAYCTPQPYQLRSKKSWEEAREAVHAEFGNRAELASRPVLARLAERIHRFDFAGWFWGNAIAFDGLLNARELRADPAYARFSSVFIQRWAGVGVCLGGPAAPRICGEGPRADVSHQDH